MKNLAIAALVLLLIVVVSGQNTKGPAPGLVWEYKFDFATTEKKANTLAAEGWELVAIESTGPGLGNNVSTFVFKRQKPAV